MNEVELYESSVPKEVNEFIDLVEAKMLDLVDEGEFELLHREPVHRFTNGMYSREFTMYAGERWTSKIHLTDHQFIISQGKAAIFNNGESIILEAPYHGITKAGTRRVLLIPDDSEPCIFTTFHPNPDNEDLEKIENRIIEKHDNRLLTHEDKKHLIT